MIEAPFSANDQLDSASGVSVDEFPSLLQQFLMFNQNKAPFQDVHVRTAIAEKLERSAL